MNKNKEVLLKEVQSVLSDSQFLILYALDPDVEMFDPQEELFHGVRILTQVQVTDRGAKAQLADALYRDMANPQVLQAACFFPHHGVRAVGGDKSVDLVICYQCWNLTIFLDGTLVNGYWSTSRTCQSLLDDLLP